MSRITIPLDALTSRLNLGERFSSVRSQSLASRFANLKPISEFLDLKRLSKPENFGEVQTRVNYNLGYFSSNYAAVFVMLAVYSLISNFWLLFDIILVVVGMWAIGKLGGSDLEIGTFKATSSQLYTGLMCVAIPTDRECFFRGGGLGGRPRTPYDVPPWGRPPGARLGRRDRAWGREQSWEYDDRFEELETDDDGLHGVELHRGYAQKRHVSDELRFTGIDLGGGGARHRRPGDIHDDDFTPSEDEEYDGSTGLIRRPETQIMLREKESLLVERALERIARARALGKTNVKLSQAEIDALDRLEQSQPPPPSPSVAPKAAPQSKKIAQAKPKAVERKKTGKSDKSSSNSPKVKAIEGRARGRSTASNRSGREREEALVPYPILPDQNQGYVGGHLQYGPQGYYASGSRPSAPSSRPGSRTNSSQSLRQQHQPMPPYQPPYYQQRYYSNPDSVYGARQSSNSSRVSRPDPSDPDWEPRARSSSSLVNYPLDKLPHHAGTGKAPRFDPSDPRYGSPETQRRIVSGPPAAQYRRPQDEHFLPGEQLEVMNYLASSSSEEEEEEEEEEDDTDDSGAGVQVNVQERPAGGYAIQTRSAAAKPANGSKGKAVKRGK